MSGWLARRGLRLTSRGERVAGVLEDAYVVVGGLLGAILVLGLLDLTWVLLCLASGTDPAAGGSGS
jgi:hypothetical protein